MASAATLNKSDQDSIDHFKKLLNAYSDLFNPEGKKNREEEGQKMEQMFEEMFKNGPSPEPIKMNVGKAVSKDHDFKNKNVKDLTGG